MRKASFSSEVSREGAKLNRHVLVASPYMVSGGLSHTVVLMLHHNEEGAAGFVLNRPANQSIRDLWQQVSQQPCSVERSFHLGGPLPGPMVALHADPSVAEFKISPSLYLAAEREHLEQLVSQSDRPYRLFVGHVGWGKGQLEDELKQGAWMPLPVEAIEVFGEEDELWVNAIREVGQSVIRSIVDPQRIPPDPLWN